MKRLFIRIAICLVVVLIAIQFVPVTRTNPPVTNALQAPDAVASILRRSCYDCHSNETIWPWYAYVAPISWLIAGDVNDGRKHLNVSSWGAMTDLKRSSKADSMAEE